MNDLTTDEDFGGRAIREAQDKAREHLAESLVQRKLDEAMEALPTFAAGAIVASDGPYVMLDVPGKPSGGQRVRHRLRPAFARQLAEVLWRTCRRLRTRRPFPRFSKLDEAMEALPTFAAGAIVASDGPYVMLDVPGKPSGGQRVRHRLRPAFARQLAEVLWRKAEEAEKEAG